VGRDRYETNLNAQFRKSSTKKGKEDPSNVHRGKKTNTVFVLADESKAKRAKAVEKFKPKTGRPSPGKGSQRATKLRHRRYRST